MVAQKAALRAIGKAAAAHRAQLQTRMRLSSQDMPLTL